MAASILPTRRRLSPLAGFPLVSISDNQRKPLAFANWLATVHHGIPPQTVRLSRCASRLSRLRRTNFPRKAPGSCDRSGPPCRDSAQARAKVDAVDAKYFREVVEPLLKQPCIEFLGEVDDVGKNELLGGAAALIFPIDWPEPFGLVMIEAMACGTPVIAWDAGSVREIIDDGVTGFIVRSVEEARSAVERIDDLDRARVRATFDRRFAVETMSRKYAGLYSRLLASESRVRERHRQPARASMTPDGAIRA
jgi:hypothetical protein